MIISIEFHYVCVKKVLSIIQCFTFLLPLNPYPSQTECETGLLFLIIYEGVKVVSVLLD